jgi:hypothetical protein
MQQLFMPNFVERFRKITKNAGPGLRRVQKCDRFKPVNPFQTTPSLLLDINKQ